MATDKQAVYLKELGHQGPPPPTQAETTKLIERLKEASKIDYNDLKSKVDILSFVERAWGPYDSVSGDWYMWRCRWHSENTPSFGVNQKTQTFCCYGGTCHVSPGDVIDFHKRNSGFSYTDEAARDLQGAQGINSDSPYIFQLPQDPEVRKQDKLSLKNAARSLLQKQAKDIIYSDSIWLPTNSWLEYAIANWGYTEESIQKYNVGVANREWYDKKEKESILIPSITYPYYWVNGSKKLINLRHRMTDTRLGKYRPEMKHLGSAIYNSVRLTEELPYLVIVEGEAKAIILEQYGFPTVSIPGELFCNKFVSGEWASELFDNTAMIFICLDPGTELWSHKAAVALGQRHDVRLVSCPVKPDDFFVKYGGKKDGFWEMLKQARAF